MAATRPKLRSAAPGQFYFRMVEVLMMLIVPLLAVALAVPPKRSTSGARHLPRDRVVVAYHKVNQYAEQAARARPDRPDRSRLWVPLLVFAGADLWMY